MQSYKNSETQGAFFACVLLVIVGCLHLIMSGCVRNDTLELAKPFEVPELENAMAIVIDTSGSFQDRVETDAWEMFINLSRRFFEDSAGSESRLIISQLSADADAVLFDGQPSDLRKRFTSPEAFASFLKENSDPSSSRVYEATRKTIDYMNSLDGVTERTRLLTVILSDLRDSEGDASIRGNTGHAMLASLEQYQKRGGALALYFVAVDEISRWREVMSRTGFESGYFIIENEITSNPTLPEFQ
jgi:hypothetical protein